MYGTNLIPMRISKRSDPIFTMLTSITQVHVVQFGFSTVITLSNVFEGVFIIDEYAVRWLLLLFRACALEGARAVWPESNLQITFVYASSFYGWLGRYNTIISIHMTKVFFCSMTDVRQCKCLSPLFIIVLWVTMFQGFMVCVSFDYDTYIFLFSG